jgi:hypothetical protein
MLIFNVTRQDKKKFVTLPTTIFKYLVIAIISLTLFAPTAYAAEIMLAWDRNPEADIAGYKVHYGTSSGYYTSEIDVGNYTTCVVSGLSEGMRRKALDRVGRATRKFRQGALPPFCCA